MAEILLIDDDAFIRETLRDMLEAAGHTVTEARDGLEGGRLAETRPFDLIVTDLVMPNKEGLETISDLRAGHPELAIIAVSGIRDREEFLEIAKDFGADETLEKPVHMDRFLAAVERCLAKRPPHA